MQRVNSKIKVVLLIGAGHSGSTLFDLVMDSHSQIAGVGELSHYHKHISHFNKEVLCNCGARLTNCLFWKRVFKDINYYRELRLFYRYKLDFLLNRKKYFYFNSRERRLDIKKYVELTEQAYKNILFYSGKKVIFDSSKNPERAEAIIRFNNNLDIILLHLVRDGRGVTYSNIKLGRSAFNFMKKWAIINLKAEIIKMRNKNIKDIFVKYEDFAKNPKRVLKYVLQQVNLTFEPDMLNFRNKVHHQAGGNFKLRMATNSSKIICDEEWRNKMSPKDKFIFNILFGWLNFFYKFKPKRY